MSLIRRTSLALPAFALAAALGQSAAARPPTDRTDAAVARDWGNLLYAIVRDERIAPPPASRMIAYWSVALYETVVPGMPHHRSLGGQLNALGEIDGPTGAGSLDFATAANAASARVLRGLLSATASANAMSSIATLEAVHEVSGPRGARSVAWGQRAADHVLAWASEDGYTAANNCAYHVPTGEGLWTPTPPAFATNPLQPCWGTLRPFVLGTSGDCAPPAPPAYSTDANSECFAAAAEVYETSLHLSSEQKAIALFWADGAGTGTPPGHWMALVGQLSADHAWPLALAAEAYVRVGLSVGDAFIACWNTKYQYNLLRPVTYIRAVIDPTWTPLIVTPPFPTYTSGHSTQSGASSTVLTDLLGDIAFTDHTADSRGLAARSFLSFTEAAEEAAVSRLYGGIHFAFDDDAGLDAGRCIGQTIIDHVRFRK